jgi:hypothetical protein
MLPVSNGRRNQLSESQVRRLALLHQLVGHVLAHRPPQEASDRLSRVCTKSAKSASGTLGAHIVLSKWYSNADSGTLCAHFVLSKWYSNAESLQTCLNICTLCAD